MKEELLKNFQAEYEKLNPSQKEAVDKIEGPVMLVAGPGSGKTKTIAMRIANILDKTQINPENILCLTFTDSAVNTMRERLVNIIGTIAYDIRTFTFHGFCNEVIQSHPGKFSDLGNNIEPLQDIDKLKILSSIVDELPFNSPLKPFGNSKIYIKDIESLISGFKRDNISIDLLEKAIEKNIDFYEKTKDIFEELKKIHYTKLTETTFTDFSIKVQSLGYSDFSFVRYLIDHLINRNKDSYTKLRNKVFDLYKKTFTKNIIEKQREFINVFKKYEITLKELGKYDYDDMIKSVVEKFSNDNELLSEYQERYQYILVDEFQDTNSSQNEVLRLLGSFWADPNIFVVGDDDQSIFRFQGASVENMASFYNSYISKIKVITLTENYRSHQLILDASRSVIKNNGLQIDEILPAINKTLHAYNSDLIGSEKIKVNEYTDTTQEYISITEQITNLLNNGVKGKEIAIIHRNNKDVNNLLPLLKAKKIKYRIERGEDILNDIDINKFINLLKYLNNSNDESLLFLILNYSFLNLPLEDLTRLYSYFISTRTKYGEIISSEEHLNKAGIINKEAFTNLNNKLLEWKSGIYNNNGVIQFLKIVNESGFMNYISSKEDSIITISKLSRLYQEFKNLSGSKNEYSLINFIEDITIYKENNIELPDKLWGQDSEESIKIMTAHGAKGQEFTHVFIIKCQASNWGVKSQINKIKPPFGLLKNQFVSSEIDEERRLFYVALTRAKKGLNISYSKYNEKQKLESPSMFIKEINDEYIDYYKNQNNEELKANSFKIIVEDVNNKDYSEIGKAFIKNQLDNFKINVSHIISYRKCPRCFFFNSILKVPSLKTKNEALGTGIHNALKILIDNFNLMGTPPTLESIKEDFIKSLKSEKLNEHDFMECLNLGQTMLSDYYIEKVNSLPKNSLTEVNFQHDNIIINGIPITGKIDRVDLIDSALKTYRVIDYKTGSANSVDSRLSEKNLGDYFIQLVFYKLLIENSKIIKGVVNEGVIEYIKKNSDNQFVSKSFELNNEHTSNVLMLIREIYDKIMNLDFKEYNKDQYNSCKNSELHNIPWIF